MLWEGLFVLIPFDDTLHVLDGFFGPVQPLFKNLFIGQWPIHFGLSHFVCQILDDDGSGNGYVQAFREANHRDFEKSIGLPHHLVAQPFFFRPKKNGGLFFRNKIREQHGIVVRSGGNDLIAFGFQFRYAIP